MRLIKEVEMRNFIFTVILSFFVIVPHSNSLAEEVKTLYAISFHADWCGSCKILGPKVIKARGKSDLDNKNVLFVKLDLTDGTKRHQSGLMANALGIGEFYKQNAGKTGFILLVNSSNGETVGKLTKDMDSNAIADKIESSIKAL